MDRSTRRFVAVFALAITAAGACARAPKPAVTPATTPARPEIPAVERVLPRPAVIDARDGAFEVTAATQVSADPGDRDAARIGALVTEYIRRASGLRVSTGAGSAPASITLSIVPGEDPEAYQLDVSTARVTLVGGGSAGLFYGWQTLRQLMPAAGEYEALLFRKPRPFTIPAVHIEDAPRFAWRGAMLDVARHFFGVDDVKRYIDLLALHKINRLHLHLADDQGWRIEIKSRPELTRVGAATEVGGTPGGFFTQEQYADLVAYAADRFITIVPEIDMPGHTNAALASYPELNCDGVARQPYTGTEVGLSALCVENEATYQFIDDVVREIAALTPTPYFHAGGDEVRRLSPAQYAAFVTRVQQIVAAHGKQMVGWDEVAAVDLLPTSIVQHWRPRTDLNRLARAPHLILSPGDRTYLDMKYDDRTSLGLTWAGLISIRQAYDWDPQTLVPGVAPSAILGVEAPLWSETLATMRDVEFMAFPRIAATAEVAWAPAASRDWEAFRKRLAAQTERWTALGINFHRVPGIEWREN